MIAIILGTIGAVAFKAPKTKATSQTNYYWFEYDESGDIIPQSTPPTAMGSDPFACPNTGLNNCASSYTSYEKVGSVYEPAGTLEHTDVRPD